MKIELENPEQVLRISADADTLETLALALDYICYNEVRIGDLTKKEQEILGELLTFLLETIC